MLISLGIKIFRIREKRYKYKIKEVEEKSYNFILKLEILLWHYYFFFFKEDGGTSYLFPLKRPGSNDPVERNIPEAHIMVSKYHFFLKENRDLGENTVSSSGAGL